MNLSQKVTPELPVEDVNVAVGNTGITVTNRGERLREKGRRGWIKVHAMIDVESNRFWPGGH
jgi:hypothetical protein